jgi:hypothetical protein
LLGAAQADEGCCDLRIVGAGGHEVGGGAGIAAVEGSGPALIGGECRGDGVWRR